MSLTEARFHDLVDATQQALEDIFDESGLDVDLESSAVCSPSSSKAAAS